MKNNILISLGLLICLNVQQLSAQSPVINWQKTYGSFDGDYAKGIKHTSDGGFITVGYSEAGTGDVLGYHGNKYIEDTWVIKLRSNGEIEWQRCIGGTGTDNGVAVEQTPDGGYAILSTSSSVDFNMVRKGGLDFSLVKLSATGEIQWEKSVGGGHNDYAYSLDLTPDGGFILSGDTQSSDGDITINHGMRDYLVAKLDGNGNKQWVKTFGGSQDDRAFGVRSAPGGGYVVAGSTESNDGDVSGNHGQRDYWVVKLDNNGNMVWQKCLGGTRSEEAWDLTIGADASYVIAGYCTSVDGDVSSKHATYGSSDFWIVKMSSSGAIIWEKSYGGVYSEIAYAITSTPGGGFAVTGTAESSDGDLLCNAGSTDMWVIKISSTGILEWQKSIGGTSFDEGYAIDALPDGTIVAAGSTCSPQIPGYHPSNNGYGTCADYFILKLSPPGPVVIPRLEIQPSSGTICAGTQVIFKASVTNAPLLYSYQWHLNGADVGTNSPEYIATSLNDNDKISCTIKGQGPCENINLQATDQSTIRVISMITNPAISISSDKTFICDLNPVVFNAQVTNIGRAPFYQWKINGINTGTNSSQYINSSVRQGDVVTCSYSDYSLCIANTAVVSNAIVITTATNQSPTVTINGPAGEICAGFAATFDAVATNAGPNPVFIWRVNGVSAGTSSSRFISSTLSDGDIVDCTVDADKSFSCGTGTTTVISNKLKIGIAARSNPTVSVTSNSTTICEGTPATFIATTTNAGINPIYSWKVNGSITGTNSNHFMTSTLADGDALSCEIIVDPAFTCTNLSTAGSATIIIRVTKQLAPSLSITASANDVCPGYDISFNAIAANAGLNPVYKWTVNNRLVGGNLPSYKTNSLNNGDHIFCTIIPGSNHCSSSEVQSNILTALIRPVPKLQILPSDTLVKAGTQLVLSAVVEGLVSAFQWTPVSKLNDATTLTPLTIPLTEKAIYTLKAENEQGCIAVTSAVVRIFRPVMMPDAFSPDGDGLNDLYRIPSNTSLKLGRLSIFDRWGNRVFSTIDISKGWDGRLNGKAASTGVYMYMLNGSDEYGDINLKGRIMLIR
ncbi:MAG: gliding motility-associated C-terminal domain-containing protein [Chitinophagaceae bacterium]|nr:MAG: gliding motility-associated C-terminal domain-containing protein [Chitinophagaceae bacterium]